MNAVISSRWTALAALGLAACFSDPVASGAAGTSGTSAAGAAGSAGTGDAGTSGASSGSNGASGSSGSSGSSGVGGTAGSSGTAGVSGTAGSAGSGNGLPTTIRLANTVHGSSIKVCLGDAGPFPATAVPFGAMSSFLAVTATGEPTAKIVEGTANCSSTALGTMTFPGTSTKPDVTIVYFDTSIASQKVGAFDNYPVDPAKNRLRVIHGIADEGPINIGLADVGFTSVFSDIDFGNTATTQTVLGDLPDSGGYLSQTAELQTHTLGAADAESSTPFVTFSADLELGDSLTFFGVGKKSDASNPVRFMICKDFTDQSGLSVCALEGTGGTGGTSNVGWECIGPVTPTPPDASTVSVSLTVADGLSADPLTNANIKACAKADLACTSPLDGGVKHTDGTGPVSFSLPTGASGFDGYFEIVDLDALHYPTLLYFPFPLTTTSVTTTAFVAGKSIFNSIAGPLAGSGGLDSARGHLTIAALNCANSNDAPGVTAGISLGDASTKIVYGGTVPNASNTSTASSPSRVFVLNVPPGAGTVTATLVDGNQHIGTYDASVRAGYITALTVAPQPE